MSKWERQRLERSAQSAAAFVIRKAQMSARMAIIEAACVIAASQHGTTRRLLTLKTKGENDARR